MFFIAVLSKSHCSSKKTLLGLLDSWFWNSNKKFKCKTKYLRFHFVVLPSDNFTSRFPDLAPLFFAFSARYRSCCSLIFVWLEGILMVSSLLGCGSLDSLVPNNSSMQRKSSHFSDQLPALLSILQQPQIIACICIRFPASFCLLF